jgi:hypothetical protein
MTWAICSLFTLYTPWFGLLPGVVSEGIDGLVCTVLLVAFALTHDHWPPISRERLRSAAVISHFLRPIDLLFFFCSHVRCPGGQS